MLKGGNQPCFAFTVEPKIPMTPFSADVVENNNMVERVLKQQIPKVNQLPEKRQASKNLPQYLITLLNAVPLLVVRHPQRQKLFANLSGRSNRGVFHGAAF